MTNEEWDNLTDWQREQHIQLAKVHRQGMAFVLYVFMIMIPIAAGVLIWVGLQ